MDRLGPFSLFVMAAVFLVCYAITSHYDYHMFQLNSYKLPVHLGWLRRNFLEGYVRRHFFMLVPLLLSLESLPFQYGHWQVVLVCVALLAQFLINWPQKAKKPLVCTDRVKRMLLTNAILTISALILSSLVEPNFRPLILTLWLLATPLVMLISNAINLPAENFINRRYVGDARRILSEMPNLIVIGVTGSYGKTSAKYFLRRLLSSRYNVLMTPGNYNTTLGVVRTIRENLRPLHEIFICEMGARNMGDIKEICDLVKPRYGVITSIGPQHLESFGSIENVTETKFELARALPDDGLLFLNFDNEYIKNEIMSGKIDGSTLLYSIEKSCCDYCARDIEVSNSGASFTVALPGSGDRRFETGLVGAHNVMNIMAAIAVADRLGVGAAEMAMDVRRIEPVPHRLQLMDRGDIIIIDDAYNSNASGAKAALDVLAMFEGFKILVTPGMIELGVSQDEYNRIFGAQAADVCDYVVLVGKRGTRSIRAGLAKGNFPDGKIFVADGIERAFEKIGSLRAPDKLGAPSKKIVLIENDLPDNY